jgi:hypothetical protein
VDLTEELRRRIEEYKTQLGQFLLAGGAKNHEDYCRAVGKVEALEYMLSDLADIEKRYMDE